MCDASLAALERLLLTPRHKFGPSHEWLANWNFPPPKAWAEAQRLAAERSNQNCADSALVLPREARVVRMMLNSEILDFSRTH